jgi:hypothetical protein
MTEAEWLACTEPHKMLQFLRGKGSDRKLRLFAVACCRRIAGWFTDPRLRQGVEAAERYADGHARREDLAAAAVAVEQVCQEACQAYDTHCRTAAAVRTLVGWEPLETDYGAVQPETLLVNQTGEAVRRAENGGRRAEPRAHQAQCRLLRDIVGNPFRPATLDRGCLTSDVLSLAQAAYDQRTLPEGELDPARLALLADALEEAGCANADILAHLRGEGPHVRGCWVVDLLLGKA